MIAPLRKSQVEFAPLSSAKAVIERVWRGSVAPGKKLPRYEDVVIGSLGRLGDHLMLFEGSATTDFKVLRAARKVREWLGVELRDKRLADLPRDCTVALAAVLEQAVAASAPMPYRMHRVADILRPRRLAALHLDADLCFKIVAQSSRQLAILSLGASDLASSNLQFGLRLLAMVVHACSVHRELSSLPSTETIFAGLDAALMNGRVSWRNLLLARLALGDSVGSVQI